MKGADLQILDDILKTRGAFGHREHVELAWRLLQHYPTHRATSVMIASIRHLARLHGADDKYHETLTRAWVHFVAVHNQRWGADGFEEFAARNPDLLDKRLIEHFYSRDLLFSDAARTRWTAPDRHPMPQLD